jgi:pimeloyl-ACP methyl ester carboxylesterase
MPIADLGDVQLHYQERGDGPPLVGVMGFALDQRFWAAQIPAVTQTHRFITFDNRGVGRSTGPLASSIEELAGDAVRLMDQLEIERTVLFGVSMGGAIAQRIVLDYPERVSALILAVTWARPIEFMRRQDAFAARVIDLEGVEGLIEASLLRMFTPRFFEVGREIIDRLVEAFLAESGPEATDPKVLLAQLDAIGRHDTIEDLARVSCPTLVVGGKLDMMVPGFGSGEIAAAIPGSRLQMFETGHGLMIEEMESFNRVLHEFLASL